MQGANKTINTKVGLDLPMSEQVRQRQVTLNEGKTLVNTKWVYGSKCVSFPNLEPYTHLVLTSVFPSFSVTCLCLTCSETQNHQLSDFKHYVSRDFRAVTAEVKITPSQRGQ